MYIVFFNYLIQTIQIVFHARWASKVCGRVRDSDRLRLHLSSALRLSGTAVIERWKWCQWTGSTYSSTARFVGMNSVWSTSEACTQHPSTWPNTRSPRRNSVSGYPNLGRHSQEKFCLRHPFASYREKKKPSCSPPLGMGNRTHPHWAPATGRAQDVHVGRMQPGWGQSVFREDGCVLSENTTLITVTWSAPNDLDHLIIDKNWWHGHLLVRRLQKNHIVCRRTAHLDLSQAHLWCFGSRVRGRLWSKIEQHVSVPVTRTLAPASVVTSPSLITFGGLSPNSFARFLKMGATFS